MNKLSTEEAFCVTVEQRINLEFHTLSEDDRLSRGRVSVPHEDAMILIVA